MVPFMQTILVFLALGTLIVEEVVYTVLTARKRDTISRSMNVFANYIAQHILLTKPSNSATSYMPYPIGSDRLVYLSRMIILNCYSYTYYYTKSAIVRSLWCMLYHR